MMVRHFFLFISLIIFSCNSQPKNCTYFKTGTFKYTATEFQNITIIRNDSIQIETDSKLGLKFISSIEWLSECRYSVTLLEVNRKYYDSIIGNTLDIDIISANEKSYEYHSYEGNTLKNIGEIIKIED